MCGRAFIFNILEVNDISHSIYFTELREEKSIYSDILAFNFFSHKGHV